MRRTAVAVVALASVAAPAAADAAAPRVQQMVVFRDGSAKVKALRAAQATVRVSGRRCVAGQGTALAALLRSRPARVRVRDYGSCGRRAVDGGGLFVYAIGRDANSGQDGWVYKVGNKLAVAGAADPDGAFGRGRLRRGAKLTWFFCRLQAAACQRTLSLSVTTAAGEATVRVRSHDDEGRAQPAAGATVRIGALTATAGADGIARVPVPAGPHSVYAEKAGEIRSLPVRFTVG